MDYRLPQVQQSLSPQDYKTILCVFGTRGWNDKRTFHNRLIEYLEELEGPILFLSGAAHSGADDMIIQWCKRYQFPCLTMPAQWRDENGKVNKRAGFERNEDMARIATHGLAFYDGFSNGTAHMLERCDVHEVKYRIAHITIKQPSAEKPVKSISNTIVGEAHYG